MVDRSAKLEDDSDAFIGFYCASELKTAALQRAEEEGVSLSEWMRRRLDEVGDEDAAAALA